MKNGYDAGDQKVTEATTEDPTRVSQTAWVRDMHSFYQRNGFYRPQDLDKVLGDPLEPMSTEAPIDLQYACKISAK